MIVTGLFSVLLTVCFFGSGHAGDDDGNAAMQTLRATTTSTKNDVEEYGKHFVYRASIKLDNEMINELEKINNTVNPVIDDIRSSISAAKENGTDAEHCFEPARLALRQASREAKVKLDRCRDDNGLRTIKSYKNYTDRIVLRGSHILTELDGIVILCLSTTDPFGYKPCIMSQIPNARAKVHGYQNMANANKATGKFVLANPLLITGSCPKSPSEKLRKTASDIRISSNNCIASS